MKRIVTRAGVCVSYSAQGLVLDFQTLADVEQLPSRLRTDTVLAAQPEMPGLPHRALVRLRRYSSSTSASEGPSGVEISRAP